MESIEIEDLLKLDSGAVTIVDIRADEDYRRGTIPHAIHIPKDEVCRRLRGHELSEPLYIMCHTGERSRELVNELEKEGYPAINVSGGYRAFLRYQLSHFLEEKPAAALKDLGD